MIDNSPVFMDDRDEAVHFVGHILEMWRAVIPNVNWALTVTPTKLRYVGNRSRVQCPECVFVEGFDAFKKAYLDAVQKEIDCRKRFCSWIFANSSGESFSLTDISGQDQRKQRPN